MVPVETGAISLMEGVSSDCWSQGGESPGNCDVCDILVVVYNVGRLVFMSMAGIALIMMIIAGIGLIINAGNPEMVARSKRLILNTFIAVLIIMAAYTIVNFTIFTLSGETFSREFWTDGEWFKGPSCK